MKRLFNNSGLFCLYNSFLVSAAALASPYWFFQLIKTERYRRGLKERLGLTYPLLKKAGDSRSLWLHAVSVGESIAIKPLLTEYQRRHPSLDIVVSTVTETGRRMVLDKLKEVDSTIYFPLDFPQCVRKSLDAVRPSLFATVETEIWPNFLRLSAEQGVPNLILNGRISPRSFKRYQKIRFFMKEIFKCIDAAAMQSQDDAMRIADLGCPEPKIHVTGNLKFDLPLPPKKDMSDRFACLKRVVGDKRLFIAGSTHQGEEEQILDVYRQVRQTNPEILLIIAPRHPDRIPKIIELVLDKGFNPQLKSELGDTSVLGRDAVILLDTMGELGSLYGLANLVFVGGSLVPTGGHNILEVAAHGIPPIFGPHMFNFKEIAGLIAECQGGWQIHHSEELAGMVLGLIGEPEKIRRAGEKALQVVIGNRGAVQKTADLLDRFLFPES